MHFGEYELSPSLISLSPLPSAHPEAFQRLLVRPSIWCYPDFSLAKGRSLGFASATADSSAHLCAFPVGGNALFRLAFASATYLMVLNLAGNGNS